MNNTIMTTGIILPRAGTHMEVWVTQQVGHLLGYRQGRHLVDFVTRSPMFKEDKDYLVLARLAELTGPVQVLTRRGLMQVILTSRRKEARAMREQALEYLTGPLTKPVLNKPSEPDKAMDLTDPIGVAALVKAIQDAQASPAPLNETSRREFKPSAPRLRTRHLGMFEHVLGKMLEYGIMNDETVAAHEIEIIRQLTGYDLKVPPVGVVQNVMKPVVTETPVPTGAVNGVIGLAATVEVDKPLEADEAFVIKAKKDVEDYWSAHATGKDFGISATMVGKIAREQGIWGRCEEGWGKMVDVGINTDSVNSQFRYGPLAREALRPALLAQKDRNEIAERAALERKVQRDAKKAKTLNGSP